ncbi:MAG: hypothetical protein H6865_03835 [Rhodospirillales bacterium]|nr:hypothetical protein [Alphaproteobacteria bacterium]MCB9986747.1 hypothetical protein [Rhodospirillales bacterium]USO08485.1 MAG: hypothetical protein H6866_04555 [Rhodospirillales bacterium]
MALHQDEAQARSELLLHDAEDALARERLQLFWKNWGSTLIGMALMLVIGTAAGVIWRNMRETRNAESTAHLIALLSDPAVPVTESAAAKLTRPQAAIAWLVRAGVVGDPATPEKRAELDAAYTAAAKAGGDMPWGWLGAWDALRLQMDDASADPEKLVDAFDKLAREIGDSPLAALPESSAAIVAGERLKDPARALAMLDRAETHAGRASEMTTNIAELRHLYEIRAQQAADSTPVQPQKEKP